MNNASPTLRLARYLLLTLLLSCVFTAVSVRIYYAQLAGSPEGNSGIVVITLLAFGWLLALALSSLTLFLNLRAAVRRHAGYSAGAFFGLPALVAGFLFAAYPLQELRPVFLLTTASYFLTLAFCFGRFRKSVAGTPGAGE